LLIDYGFTEREYFHPQRHRGTLMCHIQHRAHDDPFFAPGLQDITAHVDFSAMASAAHASGLDILGYTSQARFLLNSGLPEQLPHLNQRNLSSVQTLVSEAEMGELFKVLAIGRGIASPLMGFSQGDRRGQL
jgi:SAM-dependent MidA family methyltransferase